MKEDLLAIIESFQKNNIPELDGWTSTFFEYFFDIVGDDLLWVVEEIKTYGKNL